MSLVRRMLGLKDRVKMPSKEWHMNVEKRLFYTPDILMLERKQAHLLFVCDELMQGQREHHNFLKKEDASFVAEAWTKDRFTLFKKNLGKFSRPVPIKNQLFGTDVGKRSGKYPMLRVRGELFLVRTSLFPRLDTYRLNGVEYERVRVKVHVPYQRIYSVIETDEDSYISSKSEGLEHIQTINAWMYVGTSLAETLITDGPPSLFSQVRRLPYREPIWMNEHEYFKWTRLEEDVEE